MEKDFDFLKYSLKCLLIYWEVFGENITYNKEIKYGYSYKRQKLYYVKLRKYSTRIVSGSSVSFCFKYKTVNEKLKRVKVNNKLFRVPNTNNII